MDADLAIGVISVIVLCSYLKSCSMKLVQTGFEKAALGAPKGSLFKRYPEGSGALFALVRPWFAVPDRGFRCAPGGRQGRLYGGD